MSFEECHEQANDLPAKRDEVSQKTLHGVSKLPLAGASVTLVPPPFV